MKILNNNIIKYKQQRNTIIKVSIIIKLIIWLYCILVSQTLDNFDSSTTLNALSPISTTSTDNTVLDIQQQQHINIDSSNLLNNDIDSIKLLKDHSKSSPLVNLLIKRIFVKWDSIYFTRIAEFGYEHEQNHAFFPLFPLSMNIFGKLLYSFSFIHTLSFSDCIIVSGFIISNLSFILSAIQLLKLGYFIFNNSEFAFTSTLLYCINPAGIFTTAVYTENLFNLMVFSGLVQVFGGDDYYLFEMNGREIGTHSMPLKRRIVSTFKAAFYFSMATATRSNGILLCGFIVYIYYSNHITHFARLIFRSLNNFKTSNKRYLMKPSNSMDKLPVIGSGDTSNLFLDLFLYPILIILQSIIIILPYILFQYYGYSRYCNNDTTTTSTSNSNMNGLWPRPWCVNNNQSYPNLYSFVQNHYWNQGFFNYYTISQIPNFLFATPMVLISICSIYSYVKHYIQQPNQMIYSTFKSRSKNITIDNTLQLSSIGHSNNTFENVYFNPNLLPFIVYLSFLTIFSVTFMHVQVITRFFIHSPLIFWFTAKFFMKKIPNQISPRLINSNSNEDINNTTSTTTSTSSTTNNDLSTSLNDHNITSNDNDEKFKRILILSYFILYNVLGSVLFINFYPWT